MSDGWRRSWEVHSIDTHRVISHAGQLTSLGREEVIDLLLRYESELSAAEARADAAEQQLRDLHTFAAEIDVTGHAAEAVVERFEAAIHLAIEQLVVPVRAAHKEGS